MKIVIAADKFKGTLTAKQVAQAIAAGLKKADPNLVIDLQPIADGGDGTAMILGDATNAQKRAHPVTGPLGTVTTASYYLSGKKDSKTAYMDMSQASGLALLVPEKMDPWRASTFGTGELILAAQQAGSRTLVLGIGGSATNDGGVGCAQALGYQFTNARGKLVTELPAKIQTVTHIAPPNHIERLPTITVPCDVNNPLLGPTGATQIFGPQKGITSEQLAIQEQRLSLIADLVTDQLGVDQRDAPGAGAAGGLGFGLISFASANLVPGFDYITKQLGLEQIISAADLVITGEGRLDAQSLMGKALGELSKMAKRHNKPIVVFCGERDNSNFTQLADQIYALVQPDQASTQHLERARNNALSNAQALLTASAQDNWTAISRLLT